LNETPPSSTAPKARVLIAILLISICAGVAGSAFIHSLAWVTRLHRDHAWLIGLLPFSGILIVWITSRFAGTASRGTNLLIQASRDPSVTVPFRLAPWILGTTLLTHVAGGSAGREGTAIQMGGGIAAGISRWTRLTPEWSRIALLCGMAAGFGAVFGTPCAAALFAIECARPWKPEWRQLPACLATAWMAHGVCMLAGGDHTVFTLLLPKPAGPSIGTVSFVWLGAAAISGVGFGLIARLFVVAGHAVSKGFGWIRPGWLRPCIGGLILIGMTQLIGTRAFLGLGVLPVDPGNPSISGALAGMESAGIGPVDWLWKLVFTVVTLASGFKGGEVTPLFFIGACAGHTIGILLGVPSTLLAAVGVAGVFAGASHARLACWIMAVELFGPAIAPYAGVACIIAPFITGNTGIYEAQHRSR